ncbi:hypothetical protein GCM10011490_22540 [Pseudoclavibacter endophyticus]|uniref:Bifunctional metallophosphatase/5'-nucleotidase n=1 Tax=Pseudoclavibacter endophyticus TaxID=1778590 RepID=A0A6H9WNE5_9MICO|nr:metallophosphoesterase [Pseudoclavibacter endophyticus]KAB1648288.1 bifunctional metallophosphatase/5'-nucleotidase [Pseudoclavibacter endophyticus]GGA71353.1 hypothetical protein GCM10011490_22540 [Pseudoclavibacter endophyticus]
MTRITIAATSDLHSHWRPGTVGGIAGAAAVLAGIDRDRAVVIDAGDLLTGSPLGAHQTLLRTDAGAEHPLLTALDGLGVDAAVPGNHDFDDGLDSLLGAAAALRRTRYLCANAIGDQGEPVFAPSAVFVREGVRIGVIGAVTSHVQRLSRHGGLEHVRFTDPVTAIADQALRLRPEVDLLVAAYHGGFERDPETGAPLDYDRGENQAARLLEMPGLDGLIAGHTHSARAGTRARDDGARIAYAQPGYAGSHVGVLTFEVEAGAVQVVGARAVPVEVNAPSAHVPRAAAERLEPLHAAAEAWLDSPCPLDDDALHAAVAARAGSRRTALGLPPHPRTWRSLLAHFPAPHGASDYRVPRREFEDAVREAGARGGDSGDGRVPRTATAPRFRVVDHGGADGGADAADSPEQWVAVTANPAFGAHLHPSRVERAHLVDWLDEFARVARHVHFSGATGGDHA